MVKYQKWIISAMSLSGWTSEANSPSCSTEHQHANGSSHNIVGCVQRLGIEPAQKHK